MGRNLKAARTAGTLWGRHPCHAIPWMVSREVRGTDGTHLPVFYGKMGERVTWRAWVGTVSSLAVPFRGPTVYSAGEAP